MRNSAGGGTTGATFPHRPVMLLLGLIAICLVGFMLLTNWKTYRGERTFFDDWADWLKNKLGK